MPTPPTVFHLVALGWYFKKKIMLKEREIRMNGEISLA
jgi:hypothetical protein